ncbi:hypothetical protein [Paraburkholderia domus]|uniref:hypothetical protein n=1 Tax=Paraburkholderia domus TaxID=2793075 RepID=UPI001B8D5D51|nr:hypothetical protein [Paraburkholderia domus]
MSRQTVQTIDLKIQHLIVAALFGSTTYIAWAAGIDLPNSLLNMIGGRRLF